MNSSDTHILRGLAARLRTIGDSPEIEVLEVVNYNSECWHIGSGGLGFNSTLPSFSRPGAKPVTLRDCWGLLESQETVGVSPEMFGEFIWPYQKQLAGCFGWLYYGCCEPVEKRLEYVRQAPNLHGVSVSPWANVAQCAERCGRDYVLYCKPNPSHVAVNFAEDAVKADLDKILTPTAGNNIAVILKDLHTVSHDLSRYRRWSALAREAIRKHRKA